MDEPPFLCPFALQAEPALPPAQLRRLLAMLPARALPSPPLSTPTRTPVLACTAGGSSRWRPPTRRWAMRRCRCAALPGGWRKRWQPARLPVGGQRRLFNCASLGPNRPCPGHRPTWRLIPSSHCCCALLHSLVRAGGDSRGGAAAGRSEISEAVRRLFQQAARPCEPAPVMRLLLQPRQQLRMPLSPPAAPILGRQNVRPGRRIGHPLGAPECMHDRTCATLPISAAQK